jgi:hypothetical protein
MTTLTISDTTPRVEYTIGGSAQTAFSVPFEFYANTDLKVYDDTTLLTYAASPANATQYSVSGALVSGGGSITVGGAGLVSTTCLIYLDLPFERTSNFPLSGPFDIDSLNTQQNKFISMSLQNERDIVRTLRLATTDPAAPLMVLPLLADRKGKYLAFNTSTGNPEVGATISAVNTLSDITDEINTVAGISANVTTVAGISANVTTVAGISGNVTTVAGISADVTAVAGDATDIGVVAGQSTEIGRLGTADAVADMAILATTDVVADMNTLATADIVADMNTLGTADVVTDMNTLATADVVTDMNVLATADVVTDMNTLGTSDVVADMNTLGTADVVTDMNTLGTSANVINMATVATNVVGVNSFAERYRVASSDPVSSLDAGDLVFNTTSSALKYYTGSAWVAVTAPDVTLADATALAIALG